ncbi:hypothetical protein AOLI_G00080750 [Acnodon oligacanthus]
MQPDSRAREELANLRRQFHEEEVKPSAQPSLPQSDLTWGNLDERKITENLNSPPALMRDESGKLSTGHGSLKLRVKRPGGQRALICVSPTDICSRYLFYAEALTSVGQPSESARRDRDGRGPGRSNDSV